jgi:hypothetical protein
MVNHYEIWLIYGYYMVNIWLIMGFHCYGGSPIAGSSIMENPIKMDDLGVLGNLHVCVYIIIYIYIY